MAPGRSLRDVELRVVFAVCIFTGLRDGARAQDEGQWPPKGGELPPVSLGCASSLFEPLKGVCGFSGSELMSLIVSLQANDSELRPKYPKEACGFECNQAVLFIIRSNEACVKVNEWLPVGTHDLRDIMGKNFGKACDEHENGAHEIEAANQIMVQNPVNNHDAQNTAVPVGKGVAPAEQAPYGDGAQLYVSEESAAAQHAIDKPAQETGIKELARDNQCVEALTICQLQFPQLLSLQAGELYNDFLWEYWSCPDSCNSTLVGLLSTRRCARVLASKSKVQGSLQLGLTIQSDVELEDSASSLLSVLSGNRGLTYICSRTINPGDGQVTLVRFSVTGMKARQMTADLEEVSHSISNVLARSSDILPEQVEVELQLTGETISTDGYVVFPAKDRLKAYQFEQMLQNRLEEIFKAGTHGYNLDVDSGLTLKTLHSIRLDGAEPLPTLKETALRSASAGMQMACNPMKLMLAVVISLVLLMERV